MSAPDPFLWEIAKLCMRLRVPGCLKQKNRPLCGEYVRSRCALLRHPREIGGFPRDFVLFTGVLAVVEELRCHSDRGVSESNLREGPAARIPFRNESLHI